MTVATVICSICSSNRKSVVNAFLAAGRTPHFIEGEMKTLGSPTKAETVNRHIEKCLGGQRENAGIEMTGNGDFAAAVRAEAMRLLQAGQLKVKAEHGLTAQSLIDRRAEHAANRTLLLNITRLLVGGDTPTEVIEGEYTVLAPPELTVG